MPRGGKRMNSYLKLLVTMLISGVGGGIMGALLVMGESPLKLAAGAADYGLRQYGWLILGILGVLYIISSLIIISRTKKLMAREEYAAGDQLEQLEEQIDFSYDLGCVINNIFMAVFFSGFGLALRAAGLAGNWRNMVLLICLVICGLFVSVHRIWLVRIMQKRDPSKKGDPTDFKYNREWIESCDEAERMRIYKTGYKAFAAAQWVLILSWIGTFLSKLYFETGNGPMVIVSIMWIAQMVIHSYYKFKLRRSRLE